MKKKKIKMRMKVKIRMKMKIIIMIMKIKKKTIDQNKIIKGQNDILDENNSQIKII